MNIPIRISTNRPAVDQLIATLVSMSLDLAERVANRPTPEAPITGSERGQALDLLFAADLLGAWAMGVVAPEQSPGVRYLVQRHDALEVKPEIDETVLIWTGEQSREPWLGWWDGMRWWYVDASLAPDVIAWARRPGVSQ